MSVVGIASLVPITPGAVGVAEVAFIGILSSVAGSGMTEQLTAAVTVCSGSPNGSPRSRSGGCS